MIRILYILRNLLKLNDIGDSHLTKGQWLVSFSRLRFVFGFLDWNFPYQPCLFKMVPSKGLTPQEKESVQRIKNFTSLKSFKTKN